MIARYLRLLPLVLWVGGIFFFSIGVAPVAFHNLPSQQAGEVVRGSLRVLHLMGLTCGVLYLVLSLLRLRLRIASALTLWLVAGMMALTAFSQWWITPRIEELRRKREVQSARFSRLHSASTGIEGMVLVIGLIALWKSAQEPQT